MDATMIVLRVIHILFGVFWAGSVFFAASFLIPAVRATGPVGSQFMRQLMGVQKFSRAIGAAAILTVLSGFTLYWRDISMSQGSFARSTAGMTFGLGGLAALIALTFGLIMVARTGEQMLQLGRQIEASGGPPTPAQGQQLAAMQARTALGSRIAAFCLTIAVLAMAVARYL